MFYKSSANNIKYKIYGHEEQKKEAGALCTGLSHKGL
jgi:hypothetical protein